MTNRAFKFLFFSVIIVQQSIVLSRVCNFPTHPRKADLNITILAHPAGPTTRNEWFSNGHSILYRLEIDGVKSGQMAVDKKKFIYNSINGWGLTDFDGNLILQ